MKIYLASRFENQEKLKTIRERIHKGADHKVVSRWLDTVQIKRDNDAEWAEYSRKCSDVDLTDLESADLLILDLLCSQGAKGGLYVELGFALGQRKKVWIVGKRTNVFCFDTSIIHFDDWSSVLRELGIKCSVIAFTGKKGVGKNFVADITAKVIKDSEHKALVEFAAFADPMKKYLADVVGIEEKNLYGDDKAKNSPTGYRWESMPKWLQEKFNKSTGDVSIREALQCFGTELNRDVWDKNIWVKAMIRKIQQSKADLILITDARYQNEIDAIRAIGGKVWKVTGPQRGDEFAKEDSHSSEKTMDNTINIDYTIVNNLGDNEESLRKKIQEGIVHCFRGNHGSLQ